MANISKNQISLAGEFAVLSQLAIHGFDANLTLGNTKGVDIILSDPDTKKMRRLEVKTHSHNRPYTSKDVGYIACQWRMSDKHEQLNDEDLFFCFVSIQDHSEQFEFYIVPSAVVRDFVTNSHRYWLSGKSSRRDNPMRTFQLGSNQHEYTKPMPMIEDYRRRWDLLK